MRLPKISDYAGLLLAGWLLPFSAAAQTDPKVAYRVNCGGDAYTDPQGNHWEADNHYVGGGTWSTQSDIDGTDLDPLYQTERWADPDQGTLKYTFPVPGSQYVVRLHFAEIAVEGYMVGGRVFDVLINGEKKLDHFDVYAAATTDGRANYAVIKEFTVAPVDGKITIEFVNEVFHAKISAIEILGDPPLPPLPAAYRINCGGPGYIDPDGNLWEADRYFTGGGTYATGEAIGGTEMDPLYQSERWNDPGQPMSYVFDAPGPTYRVRLHFAEIAPEAMSAGARVFDVTLNDSTVLSDFDIYAAAGGGVANTAVVEEFTTTPKDGKITIGFVNKVHHAKISAIEIFGEAPPRKPVAVPIRINCGGSAFTDSHGNAWEADNYMIGGSTYSSYADIDGTDDDVLYQSERWLDPAFGKLAYAFPVADGVYTVRLHFAEIANEASAEGGRVFTVAINGENRLEHFDVYKEAGAANKAIVRQLRAVPVDGQIKVEFLSETYNAKVSAIEVLAGEPPPDGIQARTLLRAARPSFRIAGPGALAVRSPYAGTWQAAIRTLQGRLIAMGAGAGEGEHVFQGLPAGAYTVEIRSGASHSAFRVALTR